MDDKSMETESEKTYSLLDQQHMIHEYSDDKLRDSGRSGNSGGGRNRGTIQSHHSNNNNNNNNDTRNGRIPIQLQHNDTRCNERSVPVRSLDDGVIGTSSGTGSRQNGVGEQDMQRSQRPPRACPSPISSIVGTALNQMHLKRSSSAPMINQLGIGTGREVPETPGVSPSSTTSGLVHNSAGNNKESIADIDASALASSFLSSLGGPRPRRFSASFSPGSPGPAPNRVSQLRHENKEDWETMSEKEFHGTVNIAQSWEDLSLDSMSMEVGTRRPSISDQLWLSMPTSSAPSSPAASPRVLSRFSPSLSSPSPTRKSFTTRRSLSPIAVRPSVLAIGQGVKRKCDWDSNSSNQMDCSPQPAKRAGGLLGFNAAGSPVNQYSNSGYAFNYSPNGPNIHQQYFPGIQLQSHMTSPFNHNSSTSSGSLMSMITNHVEDSPFSNETESSVSSIGGCDSPFFRPVDSPLASVTTSPEDSPHPPLPKI